MAPTSADLWCHAVYWHRNAGMLSHHLLLPATPRRYDTHSFNGALARHRQMSKFCPLEQTTGPSHTVIHTQREASLHRRMAVVIAALTRATPEYE